MSSNGGEKTCVAIRKTNPNHHLERHMLKPIRNSQSKYVMHWNINGLGLSTDVSNTKSSKIDELEIILSECANVRVVCLNEHWFAENTINILNKIENFKVASSFCRRNKSHGGSCILLHSDISYETRDCFNYLNEECVFESCCVEIMDVPVNVIVISIYRIPGRQTAELFLSKFQSLLEDLCKERNKKIVIAADFNIDIKSESSYASRFTDLVKKHGYKLNFTESTRETGQSATCIDNVLTNYVYEDVCKFCVDLAISDHCALFVELPQTNRNSSRVKTHMRRNFSKENLLNFSHILKENKWPFDRDASSNENFEKFLNSFLDAFNEAFPPRARSNKVTNKLSWITQGIKISSERKRQLHRELKYNTNADFIKYVRLYKIVFKRVVKAAKLLANNRIILNHKNKTKAVWSVIKSELGTKVSNQEITKINIEGNTTVSPAQIPEFFNDFFINVAKSDVNVTDYQNKVNHFGLDENSEPLTKFLKVSVKDVKNTILALKNTNSTGWDGIPTNVIKAVHNIIANPLAQVINQCLEEGCFPEVLKYAEVKPLFKKGSRQVMGNYRPISILPVISKIFEKVVVSQIQDFIAKHSIILNNQFGFQQGKNTIDAVNSFIEKISTSIDKNSKVAGIFCDLTKAFDSVNHELLIYKLEKYGIRGSALKWLKSYLSNRKQRVKIALNGANYYSDWKTVSQGVPQGSILGPVLFLFYVNDLSLNISSPSVLFADDTSVLVENKDSEKISESLINILGTLEAWFQLNGLNLNISKTHMMQFRTKQSKGEQIKIIHNNQDIEEIDSVKFLGLNLDKNLSWQAHIEYLANKLGSFAFAMQVLATATDMDTRKVAYTSYFESVIRYGIVFWGNSANIVRILKIQKKIVRNMCMLNHKEPCRQLFQKLKILTLPSLYIYEIIIFLYTRQELFEQNHFVHTHHTRNKENFKLPTHRLKLYAQTPQYMGMRIYNKLKGNTLLQMNLGQLKRRLYEALILKSYYSVDEFMQDELVI